MHAQWASLTLCVREYIDGEQRGGEGKLNSSSAVLSRVFCPQFSLLLARSSFLDQWRMRERVENESSRCRDGEKSLSKLSPMRARNCLAYFNPHVFLSRSAHFMHVRIVKLLKSNGNLSKEHKKRAREITIMAII
jgi:hypothetical protein